LNGSNLILKDALLRLEALEILESLKGNQGKLERLDT